MMAPPSNRKSSGFAENKRRKSSFKAGSTPRVSVKLKLPKTSHDSNMDVQRSHSSLGLSRRQSSIVAHGPHLREGHGFTHLPEKDAKYFYQEETKGFDPFYHVDVATDCETYFFGQKARIHFRTMDHFAYIVDLDNYEYQKVVFHSFLNEILQSGFFRHGILFLVMVNAVLIGLDTLPYLSEYKFLFNILDMVILSVFIFEVMIKWIYDFRLFWTVNWNRLDFLILFLTIMAAVIPQAEYGDTASIVVNVVRAFRSLRVTGHMSSLVIVTRTVGKSAMDMGNILLVLVIFMLVLSVMAVILFDIEELREQKFLNALDAWMLLFICVTQDGWAEVLNNFRNSDHFELIACYLCFAVSIGAFVFANLIVAVIVANLELSVNTLREEASFQENPLEFEGSYQPKRVDIVPVYDILAKADFVRLSQRPLRIPRLRKVSNRRIQVYISLVVALEQNMLEAEIISLDLEKIMAVILSIVLQLDANITQLAKEDQEAAAKLLEELKAKEELLQKAKAHPPPILMPSRKDLPTLEKGKKKDNTGEEMPNLKRRESRVVFSDMDKIHPI